MKESWLAQNPNGVGELSFLFCGRQNCAPGDSVGPAVREHYLLHFCLSGRGVYQAQGRSYAIGPGEGFLILPDEVTSYQADQSEPWTHIWVGFHGSRAGEYLHQCGLGRDHRVYRCAAPDRLDHCVREMMRYETAGRGHELMLQGELYHFLGWIARSAEEPPPGAGDRQGVCGAGHGVHPQPLSGGSDGGQAGPLCGPEPQLSHHRVPERPPDVPPAVFDALPDDPGGPAAAGKQPVGGGGGPLLRLSRPADLLQGVQADPGRHSLPVPEGARAEHMSAEAETKVLPV